MGLIPSPYSCYKGIEHIWIKTDTVSYLPKNRHFLDSTRRKLLAAAHEEGEYLPVLAAVSGLSSSSLLLLLPVGELLFLFITMGGGVFAGELALCPSVRSSWSLCPMWYSSPDELCNALSEDMKEVSAPPDDGGSTSHWTEITNFPIEYETFFTDEYSKFLDRSYIYRHWTPTSLSSLSNCNLSNVTLCRNNVSIV